MKRAPIISGATGAKVSARCGSVLAAWSRRDEPVRATITSSFAGSGESRICGRDFPVRCLLPPCSDPVIFGTFLRFRSAILAHLAFYRPHLQGFTGKTATRLRRLSPARALAHRFQRGAGIGGHLRRRDIGELAPL